ncbi:MAG: SDR family NAD(P)-dependent oxidoreductase [Melioribacteraceae bacterium]|nr:SDR family NAD(P)-dependent oxidoreductase [Melioribacteraceae bacterium]
MSKTNWTAENIPDQKGKVIIVTGSSSGIGYEAARVLANKNAKVIIAVRNKEKGEIAKEKIRLQNNNTDLEVMIIDLSDLSSVKEFAKEYKSKFDKLDLLINNAGVMIPPYSKTKDGFELQFGTNHLGHFALTLQLLDVIKKTPNSRIVNVSSGAHKYGNLNFEDLAWEKRKYKAWKAYGDSKIANLYFTYELGKKLSNKNVKVTAAHPGWTATELQRHSGMVEYMNRFFAMSMGQGTLPTLRTAFDENAQSGDYYGPDGFMEMKGYPIIVKPKDLAKDSAIANKLWEVSEELTNVKFS